MVTDEAPPPLPLLLELLSSPPQAATPSASAAARQPDAAIERETKEPLLRSRLVGGDSTHAFVKWGRRVSDGSAEAAPSTLHDGRSGLRLPGRSAHTKWAAAAMTSITSVIRNASKLLMPIAQPTIQMTRP